MNTTKRVRAGELVRGTVFRRAGNHQMWRICLEVSANLRSPYVRVTYVRYDGRVVEWAHSIASDLVEAS